MRRLNASVFLALAACSGPSLEVRSSVPPEHLLVRGVAVYPVHTTWSSPAIRSLELAQREVSVIVADGRLVALGPTEIAFTGPWEDDPYRASSSAHRLFAEGVKPDEGLVFRLTADEETARSTRIVSDARGRSLGANTTLDRTVKVSLEVLHAPSHRRLYVIEGKAHVDPFASNRPDWDPDPEVTMLVQAVTNEALHRLASDHLVAPRQVELPFHWAFSPVASFAFTPDSRASFADEQAKLDPLNAELRATERVQFAAPDADDATVARLLGIRDGALLVTAVPVPLPDGLHPGDRILKAGGELVVGPQVVERQLLRAAPGTRLVLEVDRSGGRVLAYLPVPL